jgi:hypothetical protein
MAETRPDQPSSDQKRESPDYAEYITFERVISTLNLLVLAVTMGGVFWYAGEARKQNMLIATENRPVIYGNGVSALERTPDGIPNKVKVKFRNFGKSTAMSVGAIGHIFVADAGQPAPFEPICIEIARLPKGAGGTAVAPDAFIEPEWGPAAGQDLSTVNNGEVLYVTGCVRYSGVDRQQTYFSDLCVMWAPKAPQDFQPCHEPERNHVE